MLKLTELLAKGKEKILFVYFPKVLFFFMNKNYFYNKIQL